MGVRYQRHSNFRRRVRLARDSDVRLMNPSDVAKGFSQNRAALVVLVLGLVISFVAWRVAEQRIGGEAAAQFQQDAARAADAIDRRVQEDLNILIGLKGLFHASHRVTPAEFQLYLP